MTVKLMLPVIKHIKSNTGFVKNFINQQIKTVPRIRRLYSLAVYLKD